MPDHAFWCSPDLHDPEGICVARDLTAGKWEIGLSDDGTGPVVYASHPEILPAVERGALTPEDAIELGRALILQGMRGLETARVARSDDKSVVRAIARSTSC